ncbi:VOC family protein [Paenibacillus thermoaerophilus]|uniref:VOC family protein n=1 Tax=Paenibacillus thermoaerophilus TaxID=1215385 RepID=A0ABW2V622_9BACL|nr:VOC family protein [Paenibacillus thermoaerophilus]TMV18649.1 VOC family protein [Paenibacillus thermoaerophilus]
MNETVSPLVRGLGQVSVRVRDVARAAAFYRDMLGLPLLYQESKLALVACGGVRLILSAPESPQFDHPGSVLYLTVDDIHEAQERLSARGVAFAGKPHKIAELNGVATWMTFFNDSEDNTLALMSEVPAE